MPAGPELGSLTRFAGAALQHFAYTEPRTAYANNVVRKLREWALAYLLGSGMSDLDLLHHPARPDVEMKDLYDWIHTLAVVL